MNGLTTRWPASLLLLTAAILAAGCEERNEYVPPPPPEVTVAQPVERELVDFIETTGTTAASATVELRSRATGYLQEILFEDGAIVREGELLFVLEKAPFETALAMAQAGLQKATAALQLAKAELARAEELHKRRAISTSELDIKRADAMTAQADVEASEAQIRQAELDLSYTEIRAPFLGRIGRRLVDAGNLVQKEMTQLATIERFQPIYVNFYISEPEYLRLRPFHSDGSSPDGSSEPLPVHLGLADESGFPHVGHIDFRAPSIDPDTGTILFRGIFSNENEALVPGLFANVRLPVSEPKPRVLVEERAVASDQRGDYLLVLAEDDTVEYRPVTLGVRNGQMRVVQEGIGLDEWVVVNGLQRARPGAKVAPQRAGPAGAGPQQVSKKAATADLDASDGVTTAHPSS
jgi:RND family efflux transporter MFP subunit